MEFVLNRDRETKNTWRFTEEVDSPWPKQLYLTKEEVTRLGDPTEIRVTVSPTGQAISSHGGVSFT